MEEGLSTCTPHMLIIWKSIVENVTSIGNDIDDGDVDAGNAKVQFVAQNVRDEYLSTQVIKHGSWKLEAV